MHVHRPFTSFLLASLALLLCANLALADLIILKDGRELEGTAIQQGDNYWIRTDDGQKLTIPTSQVESILRGDAARRARIDSTPGSSPTPTPAASSSATFQSAKYKADAVNTPLAAVTIWQNWIDANPDAPELGAARQELERWTTLADEGAEKIRGRWVGGEERRELLAKAERLTREGFDLLLRDQTIAAIRKFEEANQVYPNSFKIAFMLGYVALLQRDHDTAIRYFEQALRINPKRPEALANLGIAYCFKKQVEKGASLLYQAAQIEDSFPIAVSLIKAISLNPSIARSRSSHHKEMMQSARLLAVKYSLPQDSAPPSFLLVPLKPEIADAGAGEVVAGMSSGTGFLVTEDGMILTNAHVVKDGKELMVMLGERDRRSAEVIAMDEALDLALIRIKPRSGEKLPYLRFIATDRPTDGAECTVMGYPMIDRLGQAIKITRGIVSSASGDGDHVLIDAKVNPGNSGGPILDRFGNVMAVVCMKSFASATEESYGIGIQAGRARAFLKKHGVTASIGDNTTDALSTEQIAALGKPATVCILATH